MNRPLVGVVCCFLVLGISVVGGSALACESDNECKGNRICVDKVCTSPQANSFSPDSTSPASKSWGQNAAIAGFASSAAVLGLAIGAEVTKSDMLPSVPLGGVATLILGAGVPMVAAGGRSSRDLGGQGHPTLRTLGRVSYVLSMIDAITLLVLGIAEIEPPPGLITLVGVGGAVSLVSYSVDALHSAQSVPKGHAQTPSEGPAFALVPTLLRSPQGEAAPGVALGLRF